LQARHDEVDVPAAPIAGPAISREAFDRLLGELRPKLHRYSARMTGSVVDGEDVLQETLVKAIEARRTDRQSRGMAVPDRAQCRARLPAPSRPARNGRSR
jgi:hypothetical protein